MGRASPEFLPSNAVRPKSKPIIVVLDMGLKTHKKSISVAALSRIPLGELHRSPDPIAGGEGASCPSPKTPPLHPPFRPRYSVPPHF